MSLEDLLSKLNASSVSLASRTVKTPEGEKKYGQPIGSIIQVDEGELEDDGSKGGKDDPDKENGQPASNEVQEKTAKGLVQELVKRGARLQTAREAIEDLDNEGQANAFLERLLADDTAPTGVPLDRNKKPEYKTKDAIPTEDGPVETKIVRWRGQNIEVPKGARTGQVPGLGGSEAVFYWYDAQKGEVHGIDVDGTKFPTYKVPAGSSIANVFGQFRKGHDDPKDKKKNAAEENIDDITRQRKTPRVRYKN